MNGRTRQDPLNLTTAGAVRRSNHPTRTPVRARLAPSRTGALALRGILPPAATTALATSSHLGSRDVPLLVHEIEIAALLPDSDLCDLLCHETSPPLLTVVGWTHAATPGCDGEP